MSSESERNESGSFGDVIAFSTGERTVMCCLLSECKEDCTDQVINHESSTGADAQGMVIGENTSR